MSRFESSRFARNPQVMNANVLKAACEALGWKYSIQNNILLVTEVGIGSNFYGEFALKLDVLTNEVTYNTFYMPNALEKVEELKEMFQVLNAEYSKNALISEFEKQDLHIDQILTLNQPRRKSLVLYGSKII